MIVKSGKVHVWDIDVLSPRKIQELGKMYDCQGISWQVTAHNLQKFIFDFWVESGGRLRNYRNRGHRSVWTYRNYVIREHYA